MKNFGLLLVIALAFTLTNCVKEGPVGPAGATGPKGDTGVAGADGQNGADANTHCLDCHSIANWDAITTDWEASAHGIGANVGYAGGRSGCAQCHSAQGFILLTELGLEDMAINHASGINCKASCHPLITPFTGNSIGSPLSTEESNTVPSNKVPW